MSKVITEVNSTVNELFAKSIVTQKFSNPTDNPIELKIYIIKNDKLLFSSFKCKIGDNVEVKSKVIKKEKAEVKYTDSIASGNAAIFVSQDPENENRTIINMGNIPPKNEVIFTTEFIHLIEASEKYEFELFRNLPIFKGGEDIYQNSELKGKIQISAKNEIINIEKKILMKNLKITEEKYINDKKTNYIILYEIDQLPEFSWNNYEYIPSSKIYFDSINNKPFIYCQESSLNETNYILNYRYKKEKSENDEEISHPAIFIFLLDQSGSMSGERIKIASKALELFIQSLPAGSYYQIIGFGSDYKVYDDAPKEYNIDNIKNSLEMIKKLGADLGGTNIEGPLKYIYDSDSKYEKIKLPRNIILLTDGEAWDKEKGLILIEKNNSKFMLHSIGIGNDFDEDLIKNAATLGKGNYNFCKDLDNLNNIIASEINKATSSYVTNIEIKSNLDEKNKIKNCNIPNILRDNSLINLYYILDNNIDNINLNIKYDDKEIDKTIENNYKIIPEILEKGDDLSKLIIYNYINNDKNISEDEKIKLALKYQIFIKNTSLFAEINFSEKITEEMKLKIIGKKEDNIIPILRREERYIDIGCEQEACCYKCCDYDDDECCDDDDDECCDGDDEDGCYMMCSSPPKAHYENYNNNSSDKNEVGSDLIEEKKIIKKEEKIDLNEKERIMKMVGTQNFVEGFWEDNEYTKEIKNKYQKEYEQIKGIKNKNMNDNIALTILIIYFLNKEHPNLMSELIMIIKKAKQFISKQTKDNYDNIIKEIGLN
jgi:uncharacterized protein YegL